MVRMSVSLRKQGFDRRMEALEQAGGNFRPVFREFAQYMRVQTESMFRKLRKGGRHRGVLWKYFAPQYVRKDGTVVPAWGGIPKVRGKGKVKGRLRPSGARVTSRAALMRDTGTMSSRAALVLRNQRTRLVLGPQGVNYAEYQQGLRRFLFFHEPRDTRQLGRILSRHLRKPKP